MFKRISEATGISVSPHSLQPILSKPRQLIRWVIPLVALALLVSVAAPATAQTLGSCQGSVYRGNFGSNGTECWCDAFCHANHDCCDDRNKYAADDAADSSCSGNMGGVAPSGCWCDGACIDAGDCCTDILEVAAEPGGGCPVLGLRQVPIYAVRTAKTSTGFTFLGIPNAPDAVTITREEIADWVQAANDIYERSCAGIQLVYDTTSTYNYEIDNTSLPLVFAKINYLGNTAIHEMLNYANGNNSYQAARTWVSAKRASIGNKMVVFFRNNQAEMGNGFAVDGEFVVLPGKLKEIRPQTIYSEHPQLAHDVAHYFGMEHTFASNNGSDSLRNLQLTQAFLANLPAPATHSMIGLDGDNIVDTPPWNGPTGSWTITPVNEPTRCDLPSTLNYSAANGSALQQHIPAQFLMSYMTRCIDVEDRRYTPLQVKFLRSALNTLAPFVHN